MNTVVSGSALVIKAPESATALQGTLGTELALPVHRQLRLELAATGTTFGALASKVGTSRNGLIRPQYSFDHFGVYATGGAGKSRRAGEDNRAFSWDAGAWAGHSGVSGSLTLSRSFTNDYMLVEPSGFTLIREARYYALQDALATVSARNGRLGVTANYARRKGVGATIGSDNAFAASLTTNVSSRLSVIITAGKQLADIVSGIPAAHVFSASMQYQWANLSPRKRAAPAVPEPRSPFDTRVEPRAAGGAIVTVRVNAPADATVELMGTHNEWTIVPLTRVNDAFAIRLELPSGSHRLAVRVNGGEWKAPQGLARAVDDLGGESGIVIVP